jgi:hypothetical protein
MSARLGKPLASLSSALLARKGHAKPAMRSQGFGGFSVGAVQSADDLGWNDMGASEAPAPTPTPTLVAPSPGPSAPVLPPAVVVMREALKEEIEAPAPEPEPAAEVVRPVSLATAARISRDSAKQTKGGKAAFTLRLDAARHLRLRLASAVSNRSAQVLVADALDHFLDTMPEVDALAAQLPEPTRPTPRPRPRKA